MAPTRAHPAAPQTGGLAQKAAGVQGSIHDKVCLQVIHINPGLITAPSPQIIETLEGRNFVELKYDHPESF